MAYTIEADGRRYAQQDATFTCLECQAQAHEGGHLAIQHLARCQPQRILRASWPKYKMKDRIAHCSTLVKCDWIRTLGYVPTRHRWQTIFYKHTKSDVVGAMNKVQAAWKTSRFWTDDPGEVGETPCPE